MAALRSSSNLRTSFLISSTEFVSFWPAARAFAVQIKTAATRGNTTIRRIILSFPEVRSLLKSILPFILKRRICF
jgi:hypothetical protein